MKKLFMFIVLATFCFAYEKGQIDMHGGKKDSLTSKNVLNKVIGLGTVLNKKDSEKKEIKDKKNFIEIEEIEKIEEKK